MKGLAGAVVSTAFLLLAGCGGDDSDPDAPGSAAPDVGAETTPPPVPLPPETQPVNPDSGPAATLPPLPQDSAR